MQRRQLRREERSLRLRAKGANPEAFSAVTESFAFFPRLILVLLALVVAATGLWFVFY